MWEVARVWLSEIISFISPHLLLDFIASSVPQSPLGVVTADTCDSQALFSLLGALPAQKFTFGGPKSLMVL